MYKKIDIIEEKGAMELRSGGPDHDGLKKSGRLVN